jgi:hypothetical protein
MSVKLCEECGERAEIIEIDYGVGPTWYGSEFSIHEDKALVTRCCESSRVVECDDFMEPAIRRYLKRYGYTKTLFTHNAQIREL